MTKNTKQQNLLNRSKRVPKASQSNLAKSLQAFKNAQNQETVTYTDINGNEHSKKITLKDPGIRQRSRFNDLTQTSSFTADWAGAYELIMKHVVVKPQLSFESEEAKLPKSLKTKNITAKNKNGSKVTLHFVFPGYKSAVRILNGVYTPTGGLDMSTLLDDLESDVFRTDQGKPVKDSYFDIGGQAFGLGYRAIFGALHFLGTVVNYDGFNSMVSKGMSFLSPSVPR